MALIVITVADDENGVAVGVQMEPPIDSSNPDAVLTGAQVVALDILRAASEEHPIKQDGGLIQLVK